MDMCLCLFWKGHTQEYDYYLPRLRNTPVRTAALSKSGLIDPRSGERACNSCRDGEVLVVTNNRTLPFSKACPNPLKNWPKPLAKLYNSPKNSRAQPA